MPDPAAAAALQTGDTQQNATASTAASTTATPATADPNAALATSAAAAALNGTTTAAPPIWPEDWRKQMVGDDEKELKQAERYASPRDIWKKARELETQISSGKFIRPLAEDATPEQVTAWRKERGIPEKPEGYLENLPDGLVIGAEDKLIFDQFMTRLHKHNADPKVAHELVSWYSDFQEETKAKQAEDDKAQSLERVDKLRADWGADYRANIQHLTTFLESAPEGVEASIADARDSSGRLLLSNPAAVQWFAQLARQTNPALTPGGDNTGDPASIDGRIAEINKFMRTNRSEYNKDPKMQKELLDLITRQQKLKANAA